MRVAVIAVALVLVAVPWAWTQENEAEKLYRSMVDKLSKARTVKVAVELQGTPFGQTKTANPKFKQTIWLADGNKVRWLFEQPIGDKMEKDGLAVCDGKKLAFRSSAAKLTLDADDGLASKLRESLASHGCWNAIAALNFALDPEGKAYKPIIASNFKLVGKEKVGGKDHQVLRYVVRERGGDPALGGTYTVWIDAATLLPSKMLLETAGNFRVEEAFVEWQLDGKVDARLFELPK